MKEVLARSLHLSELLRYLNRRKTIILLYHLFTRQGARVTEESNDIAGEMIPFMMDTKTFERHVVYLRRHYNIISLDCMIRHYVTHTEASSNSIVITIDDGHESVYTLAYPILKRYRVPVTLFIVADRIDNKGTLKWNQLMEMMESGLVSVGSHTCTHPLLTRCSSADLTREVRLSKELIERHTQSNCHLFAYPYGGVDAFDKETEKLLKESGYSCGLATIGRMNDKSSNLYALKRLDVSSEYNLERVLRRAYIKESTLLSNLLGRFFVQLDSFLKFKRKLIHGYWLMNWIKRKRNRQMLRKVRGGADHISSIEAPLVSVIIPTYNRGQLLVKRAIPSVLNQTYQNFEIVIVGDHCTDDTQVLVQEIDDKRVSFHNLPTRSCYPANSRDRKLVAGATAANKALELSRGDWITRLDDDDEFSNNHIEALLKYALRCKYEFVYGRVEIEAAPNQWVIIGSYPPRCGQMTNIGVLYNSRLRFFGYDVLAWKYAEPDDWNLFRRMIEAGVRVGFIDEVVGRAYLGKRKNRLS